MEPLAALYARACPRGECLLWTGARIRGGYGRVYWHGRRLVVHRLVYELAHGPLGPGQFVKHRCEQPHCLRLEHLYVAPARVTRAELARKGARWARAAVDAARGYERQSGLVQPLLPGRLTRRGGTQHERGRVLRAVASARSGAARARRATGRSRPALPVRAAAYHGRPGSIHGAPARAVARLAWRGAGCALLRAGPVRDRHCAR